MNLTALHSIADSFVSELEKAERGEKSSLLYIRNTIPSFPLVKDGEKFQTMAIGGTNFKSAIVKKKGKSLEMIDFKDKVQPPVFETKENFLNFVLENLASDVTTLAINFAFPLEPVFANGKLEANFLYSTKEHTFKGLVGKNVAVEIEKYIKGKLERDMKVSLANDTICLLLSGTMYANGENLAAGIVGTGLNFAFFADQTTLINTESGGFNMFELSPIAKVIDRESAVKDHYLFEKVIAGAYLYLYFNMVAKERGYFITPLKNTKQLTDIAAREDGSQVCLLAQEILRISAQYAAAGIAGITKYKKRDMNFVMVGSLFWKGEGYKTIVRETVKQLVPEYNVEFLGIENSDLLGAAKLVA